MDLEQLVLAPRIIPAEVPYGLHRRGPHQLRAGLEPAAEAQTHADVGAVGDRQRALEAREGAEEGAWDPAELHAPRRIVRVQPDEDAGLLRHGPA